MGLSKYKEQIKSIGLIAAAATGQLEPFLKIVAAAEGFFGGNKATPLPETNDAKPEVFGPEYKPSAVEDPRVKKARDEEEKRLVERGDMIRKLEAQDVKDREKHTNQMRTANEEYAKM